jgi:hypothetical protein
MKLAECKTLSQNSTKDGLRRLLCLGKYQKKLSLQAALTSHSRLWREPGEVMFAHCLMVFLKHLFGKQGETYSRIWTILADKYSKIQPFGADLKI